MAKEFSIAEGLAAGTVALVAVAVGVAVIVVATALGLVINGWVFYKLWSWFVVPEFGLPQLSFLSAIGIGLVINFTTHQAHTQSAPGEQTNWGKVFSNLFLYPGIVLLTGYVIKFWIM